ncbi:hypothetical protein PV646_28575 [Streptomyces sp. ID05-26A]|nr:hypothetical protein [Streptomyces sp. ID05-26A]
MPELINLTPHPIRIYTPEAPSTVTDIDDGLVTIIPPSGLVARLANADPKGVAFTTRYLPFGEAQIQVERVVFTTVFGLPAKREDVYLIVPLVTALAEQSENPARDDLLVPHEQVRNAEGTVVGCRTLAQPC